MGTRDQRVGGLAVALLVLSMATQVWAAEASPTHMSRSIGKLGRGIANIATCPLELVRTPALVGRQDGSIAAMTVGLLQGVWRTLVRGTAGVFEVVTFYAEIPKDFQPIVKPEFVWVHGNWAE